MHPRIEQLLAEKPVLTDGGWGTQLYLQGLEPGACPDEWNLSHPAEVQAVAQAYVDAGSRIILTNTFGASSLKLRRHGLAEKAVEINRRGAEISKAAAGDQTLVFASIGPSGLMLMMGQTNASELEAAFGEQARALADGGADGLVIETMSDPAEAAIAVAAARATGLPVVASMVFGRGDRTMMGTTPEQAAVAMTEAGADVVGANCGQGIEGFITICRRLHASTDRPIWIKANAGLPKLVGTETVYEQAPVDFARAVPAVIEAGADFIGGCCGTTPDTIRATRAVLA